MNLTFGQNVIKSYKSFYESSIHKYSDESYKLVQLGDSLYNNSINDEQRIYSLITSGIGYYNLKNYGNSLKVSKKADSIARKNGINEQELRTSLLLYNIYSNSEYNSYSDIEKQRIYTLLSKRKNDKIYRNVIKAINLNIPYIDLNSSDYVKIKEELKKEITFYKDENVDNKTIFNHLNSLLRLANLYRQDKDYDNAKYYYNYSKLLCEKKGISDELIDLKIYFGLGEIALYEGDFQLSNDYLSKSLEIAKLKDYKGSIEIINSKLAILEDQRIEEINKNEHLNTDSVKSQNIVSNYSKYYYFIILIFLLILFISFYLFKQKKKNQKKYFENIIENLNKDNLYNSAFESQKLDNEFLEILKKIEDDKEFLNHNLSLASVAFKNKVSSSKLEDAIKKYKNRNFEDYISYLKIYNIINKLNNNPDLLEYDINRISEIAGFYSKMEFITMFKRETNLSPSEFINLLQKTVKK